MVAVLSINFTFCRSDIYNFGMTSKRMLSFANDQSLDRVMWKDGYLRIIHVRFTFIIVEIFT